MLKRQKWRGAEWCARWLKGPPERFPQEGQSLLLNSRGAYRKASCAEASRLLCLGNIGNIGNIGDKAPGHVPDYFSGRETNPNAGQ